MGQVWKSQALLWAAWLFTCPTMAESSQKPGALVAATTAEAEIRPQPGPQITALQSKADILIYGGQAGGGKTWFLTAEPLRRVHNSGFRGVIFRRTYPQIMGQGGLWEEANALYRPQGGKMREGDKLDVTFPSGATIAFCHLQHEKTKYEYQGHQICYIGFDELTHFTQSQFFYLVSRNRSTCGIRPYIRATCNPDAGSWVATFIEWWIGDDGLPIAERSGKLRYFVRDDQDNLTWADSKQELIDQFPQYTAEQILSVTFVPATLDDNPALTRKDPGYKAKLMAMPRIERLRLLGGNWKVSEGSLIELEWFKRYQTHPDGSIEFPHIGLTFKLPPNKFRRIATIDTAGTSKEKAAEQRGDPPSWSVCGVWDVLPSYLTIDHGSKLVLTELLFLRHVWRAQVDWNQLKAQIPPVLSTWNVQRTFIENAHYGKPLVAELRGFQTELIGPTISGMDDSSRGAKLERAVASGMLSRVELGKIFIPDDSPPWLAAYIREMTVWTGLPKETADQVDMTSYASYVTRGTSNGRWGGVLAN